MITVCDKCLRASCWQGFFLCDDASEAGTVEMPRAALLALALESTHYLTEDEEDADATSEIDVQITGRWEK